MRKQTKVAVVASAAALLAMGASMTSFAKGWTLEDNEWVWLDSEGERVYGEWKKSVDGNYYWLDEETGVMATDRLVEDEDDTYYVNSDGIRITNAWKDVDNEDGESVGDITPDTLWYYFGSNGKAYKASETAKDDKAKKTINGQTYFFDESGRMHSGWLQYDGNTYYCGDEEQGWAFKGWQYLETEPAVDAEVLPDGTYEDEEWIYFDGGKMVKGKTKYIDGHYFSFDDNGVMETGWIENVVGATTANGVGTDAQAYAADNGVMSSGWVKADKNDESKWFYMVTVRSNDGKNAYRAVPFNSGSEFYRAKSIDGKVYAFDTEGRMLTGLQNLGTAEKPLPTEETDVYDGVSYKNLTAGTYYFEKSGANMGAMKTGKVTVTEDGEDFNYYFGKDGKALKATIKDNVIYGVDGIREEAKDGNAYEIINLTYDVADADGNVVIPGATGSEESYEVVVSSTGKVRTSGTVRIDGEKYDIVFDKTNKKFEVNLITED